MSGHIGFVVLGFLLSVCQGCSTFEGYQGGYSMEQERIHRIKKGMAKAEVLHVLGSPSETTFIDPDPMDAQSQVHLIETMVYRFTTVEKTTEPPIFGGATTQTGRLQQLNVQLENGIVTSHDYTEETP